MDYLDDPSLDIFTEGQRVRMTAALNTASDRNTLWTTTNLQATGSGPYGRIKANFALQGCDQPPCHVCPGQTLNFISYSMGKPNQFTWEIRQGSTVISSSTTGACVAMTAPSTPGTYDVRLQVSNLANNTHDTTYMNFFVVRDPSLAAAYPFSAGFEGTTFPPSGWTRQNPDFATANSNLTWERYASTGRGSFGASNAMARLRNFSYFNRAQRDHLITPLIDIPASAQNPAIEFDVFYRAIYWENISASPVQHGYLYGDTLAVYISSDCGSTWERLYYKGGEELDVTGTSIQVTGRAINSGDQAIPPTGANTSWRHEAIPVPATYKGQKVLIRFENITEMGNTLYLDSIQVRENNTTVIGSLSILPTLTLLPNPTSGDAILLIKNGPGLPLNWAIYDVQGRAVLQGSAHIESAEVRLPVHTAPLAGGLYLLKAQVGTETTLLRLIKE
jgi:hypothetical protein